MNRPTPETDLLITRYWGNGHAAKHLQFPMRKLERQRDEARELAREEFEEQLRIALDGHKDSKLWGENGLIAATMRASRAFEEMSELAGHLSDALEMQISLPYDRSRYEHCCDLLTKAKEVLP